MKRPGMAIAIMSKRPKEDMEEDEGSSVKDIAGEIFDFIKEDDKEGFINALQDLVDVIQSDE